MSKKVATIIATYCGLGLSPKAPGTVGSIGTLPLAFVLAYYGGIYAIAIAVVIIFVIGTLATDVLVRDSTDKDPKKVVVDEVVGQLLTFVLVADYLYHNLNTWYLYAAGLLFFRFFDICKMGPVKWFDKNVKNAYGVMMDDVCAGIFGSICLWMFKSYLPLIL